MKTETKEIYKCDHCNKLYQIKNRCLEHEKVCKKNPDNQRACFGCQYLVKENTTIYYDTFRGESKRVVSLLHCNELNTFLHPPKVEYKNNKYETYPKENNPMPKTCELYNDGYTGLDLLNLIKP